MALFWMYNFISVEIFHLVCQVVFSALVVLFRPVFKAYCSTILIVEPLI